MPLHTTTRWINSPVETVFARICDLRTYFQSVSQIAVVDWAHTSELAVDVIGTLRAGQRILAVRVSAYTTCQVVELEITEGKRVTSERLAFEKALGGTRVTHTTDSTTGPDVYGNYRLLPTQRAIDQALGALKYELEKTSTYSTLFAWTASTHRRPRTRQARTERNE